MYKIIYVFLFVVIESIYYNPSLVFLAPLSVKITKKVAAVIKI